MSEYKVNLENIFSGPLDLLLYLVRKDEVDIYDIPIAGITEQYLGYIDMLQNLDIDLAGDFLVMAATLMEIKSAMLLPKEKAQEGDNDDGGDPRSELIRQLLEYKKFKDAAMMLDCNQQEQQLRFPRPDSMIGKIRPDTEPEIDMEEVSIWNLLEVFDGLMRQTGRYMDYSQIKDETSIDQYQVEILARLQQEGAMSFDHIFKGINNRLVMIGLFLALLELIRNKLVWVEQADSGTIYAKALTDEPAQEAVHAAILANEEEQLAKVAQRMAGELGNLESQDGETSEAIDAESGFDYEEFDESDPEANRESVSDNEMDFSDEDDEESLDQKEIEKLLGDDYMDMSGDNEEDSVSLNSDDTEEYEELTDDDS